MSKRIRKGDPVKVARNIVGVAGFAALREAGLTVVYADDIARLARSLPPEAASPAPQPQPPPEDGSQ